MNNLDTVYTDATRYESVMRYPTEQKLLWECNENAYAIMCKASGRLGIHRPRTKYLDVEKANMGYKEDGTRLQHCVKMHKRLQVSAPDIKGLWDFTHVPGTLREDGTLDTTTGCSGLADIIMSATKEPEACWSFLKWWTSAEIQTLYGREMESLMGASARVATANLDALAGLSWPIRDYRELARQFSHVKGIPQVPGGYYTWRNVNNAFYAVTTGSASSGRSENGNTPREELMDKIFYINAEITYKRTEFGLPVANAGEGK